jgi:hypothetical protein
MVSLNGSFPKTPSYHLGVFGSYHFTDKVALNVDVLYSDKGFQSPWFSDGITRFHMVYLSTPLTVEYNLSDRFSVLGGVELNYLLSAYHKDDGEKVYDEQYNRPVDWGIVGGIAFQPDSRWNTMLRYTRGLSDLANGKYSWGPVRSRVLQLSLSYSLNHKGHNVSSNTSQPDSTSWVTYGIKAGMNVNETYYTNLYNDGRSRSAVMGVNVGMFLRMKMSQRLAIIWELQYARKGYKEEIDDVDENFLLHYIEVPLLLSWDVGGHLSIEPGISMGWLIKASTPEDKSEYDYTENEYTAIFGLRWRTKHRFSFGGRIYLGLSDVGRYGDYGVEEYSVGAQFFTYIRL